MLENDVIKIMDDLEIEKANFVGLSFENLVEKILIDKDRVSGILLDNGESIYAPVVVNVAGPHSMKINQMAGVENDMNIKTKALKVEVAHVKPPKGFDYENN